MDDSINNESIRIMEDSNKVEELFCRALAPIIVTEARKISVKICEGCYYGEMENQRAHYPDGCLANEKEAIDNYADTAATIAATKLEDVLNRIKSELEENENEFREITLLQFLQFMCVGKYRLSALHRLNQPPFSRLLMKTKEIIINDVKHEKIEPFDENMRDHYMYSDNSD